MNKFLRLISILSIIATTFISGTVGAFAADDGACSPAGVYAFGNMRFNVADSSTAAEIIPSEKMADYKDLKLYVGGMPFGVKFLTAGVIVAGFNEGDTKGNPAKCAGLRCNDIILSVNGEEINGAAQLNDLVCKSKGSTLNIRYSRNGAECRVNVTPIYSKSEGRYTIGIYVRDSGAGIGTVTFICPGTKAFGGLGHGICDCETGRLIPMQRGSVVGVKINGVVKGISGAPGEVKGYFNSGKTGTLLSNTHCGVYGVFAELPKETAKDPVSLGLRDSVKEGKAYLYTMLDGDSVEKYEIEISEIQRESTTNKCFTVKVTDKRLLDKTGGIIQGMSGSPIIQNGKLVGAVTHVMINDPTTGYGIFIENMLNAAQMPMAKAS